MSQRLRSTFFIVFGLTSIMFQSTLNYIQFQVSVPSQREGLINLLKNAEKQAKTDERILYLTQCRRRQVCPSFLNNCLQSARYVLGDSGKMRHINETYLQKCLSECIKTTNRRQAYLRREHNRLIQTSESLPLFHWTVEKCNALYQQERLLASRRLSKKFAKLTTDKYKRDEEEGTREGGSIQKDGQQTHGHAKRAPMTRQTATAPSRRTATSSYGRTRTRRRRGKTLQGSQIKKRTSQRCGKTLWRRQAQDMTMTSQMYGMMLLRR